MADPLLQCIHPRRAGIGDALARAFPMSDDREARREAHLLRRVEIGKAVRG